jgi:hypothetical protein
MNAKSLVVLAACFAMAAATLAQDADSPLRGPSVSAHAKRTLVHFNMSGEFERIAGRPEAAAVQLLNLDEPTAQRAAEVFAERDMAVAMLLVDEIDLVREVSDAIIAGESERARELQLELWSVFEPDTPSSPLLEPLAEVLSGDQLAEVAQLTGEYWEALIDWQTRNRKETEPDRVAELRARVEHQLAFGLFQQEVRIGYEATLRRYRDAMEGIYTAVEPTDEQRERLREILVEHIRTTKLSATPTQRRASTRKMYDALDEERRGKFFDYLLGQIVPDTE